MKNCSKCHVKKEENCFHKSKSRGFQSVCKLCRKEIDKQYWKSRSLNEEKMQDKKNYLANRRNEFRKFIYEYVSTHPCVDCSENDPIVLTFDHLFDKKFNISDASNGSVSMDSLKSEIEKCEVRCANCHLRKTAKDFN